MNSVLPLQPRRADDIRNVQAARLAANTFSHLPIGFWQRRIAARAFGLSVVPPVDRYEPGRAVCWTIGGPDPVFVLETGVAIWGFAPRSGRDPVAVLQMLRAIGPRPFTAVITVVPLPVAEPITTPASSRRRVLLSDALQIGVLHWHDVAAVFDDAATMLEQPTLAALAFEAADAMRALERAELADAEMALD
jgi:hypothetical protein